MKERYKSLNKKLGARKHRESGRTHIGCVIKLGGLDIPFMLQRKVGHCQNYTNVFFTYDKCYLVWNKQSSHDLVLSI